MSVTREGPTATGAAPAIVAIGASLGGLVAMQTILRGLPATFRCPIVLAARR